MVKNTENRRPPTSTQIANRIEKSYASFNDQPKLLRRAKIQTYDRVAQPVPVGLDAADAKQHRVVLMREEFFAH